MTKIAEALRPIGSQAKLYTTAVDTLRGHGIDVARALPAFVSHLRNPAMLNAIASNYLERVCADMRFSRTATKVAASPGQISVEAHDRDAGAHPSTAADAKTAEAAASPGHAAFEAQLAHAGAHSSSMVADAKQAKVAVSPGQTRDEAQHAVAGAHPSTKKRIAVVHELRTRAIESMRLGFGFVVRGKDDIVDGIAYQLIAGFVHASDPEARVKDVVSEATLKKIRTMAIKAAKRSIDKVNQMPREVLAEIARTERLRIER